MIIDVYIYTFKNIKNNYDKQGESDWHKPDRVVHHRLTGRRDHSPRAFHQQQQPILTAPIQPENASRDDLLLPQDPLPIQHHHIGDAVQLLAGARLRREAHSQRDRSAELSHLSPNHHRIHTSRLQQTAHTLVLLALQLLARLSLECAQCSRAQSLLQTAFVHTVEAQPATVCCAPRLV